MKKSLIKATAAFGITLFALAAHAGQVNSAKAMDMDMSNMKMESGGTKSSSAMGMNEGEVKAVDQAKKSITIKHGHIKSKSVEMMPMTMSFPVQKASLLSNVKVGDKVKFIVENDNNVATVTSLSVKK